MDVGQHCRALPGASEEYPFGPEATVFKVGGKMFAILSGDGISLKCDPALAIVLREQWPAVSPGYHLNKRHWNTVRLDGSVPDTELAAWIDDSYELVVDSLSRGQREALRST
jgi:predicted DNA-binding protein (MmcQ/YjbR family)